MISTKKKRMRLLSQGFLIGLALLSATSFNNCGQPGAINLQNTDQLSSDALGTPDVNPGTPVVPKKLVAKQMNVDVTSTTNKKLDVLVVIDNSGSMATEQGNMAQRFNTFIDQLNGLDWQVGIVTTDLSGSGSLKDGNLIPFSSNGISGRILTSAMDINAAKAAFANTIQRPETGSGDEQGIGAAYRAVERSQTAGSDNAALFRPDGALAIVIVTDANETPTNGNFTARNDPAQLLSLVKRLWPQKSVNVHSIIVKSGDSVCLQKDGNESYGTVYEAASSATGGIIGTVCATDYSSQLTLIGQTAAGLVNSITLECTPVDGTGDGIVDIAIRNPNLAYITNYSLKGVQIKLSAPLEIGRTSVNYFCLQ